MKKTKNIITGLLLILAVVIISGCRTIEGAGKDIERGGQGIQDVTR